MDSAVMAGEGAALLHAGFLRSAELMPDAPALVVDRDTLSYRELRERAAALAATLQQRTPAGGPPLTAVFAHRTSTAFAGILGALFAGRGYVPLNRTFPPGRTRSMLQRSACRGLIVDEGSEEQLDTVLEGVRVALLIVLPDRRDVSALARRWPGHLVLGGSDLDAAESWTPPPVSPDEVAYLLFTSGSTGTPKGVMVTHRNSTHFVNAMADHCGISCHDRFSQVFDLTFDLSVLDTFVAWRGGACVCCPSGHALLDADRFIRRMNLSVWTSVPSIGVLMKRLGVLTPNRYPSLRWSLFCGEALPVDLARTWSASAPMSTVENLYGPTELTVACTRYRWDALRSPGESEIGVVPIGHPLPDMQAIVADDALREVEPGEVGELLMAGPQVTPGYWRDAEATHRSFVRPPGRSAVFFRTGDRVRRPVGHQPFTYLGRLDHQIKVLGHRVELGEVEAALREEPGVNEAVALGWPVTISGAAGIVAFLAGQNVDGSVVRSSLSAKLPGHAVPHAVHVLPELPQNASGKIDRQALLRFLDHQGRLDAGQVRDVILSCLEPALATTGLTRQQVSEDFDIRAEGLVDSVGFVQLIGELEARLGVDLELHELVARNLTAIAQLSRYIAGRCALGERGGAK